MAERFDPSTPIYLQLADRIKNKMIRGELAPGQQLPSVRELAVASGVNPNTVQHTYKELEDSGIVEKHRGQGTFATENKAILQQLREEMKERYIARFVQQMRDMGCGDREISDGLRQYFAKKEEKP